MSNKIYKAMIKFALLSFLMFNQSVELLSLSKKYFFSELSLASSQFSLDINDSNYFKSNIFVAPNNFGLNELNRIGVAFSGRIFNPLISSLSFQALNNSKYNEYELSFSTVYKLEKFKIGFDADYTNLKIQSYLSNSKISFSIFGVLKYDNDLSAGFLLSNINKAKYKDSAINDNNYILLFLKYNIFDDYAINLGFNQEFAKNNSFSVAMDFELLNFLKIYLGYNINPQIFTFLGKMEIYNNTFLSFNYSYFNLLGLIHSYGLSYSF